MLKREKNQQSMHVWLLSLEPVVCHDQPKLHFKDYKVGTINYVCFYFRSLFFFFNYNYCHVNPERTESTELVRAVFMGSEWTLSNAQYLTYITVLFSFYDPFIYFKSNILSLRISFKITATLRCLPQITILARLLLTLHWQLNTVCFPGLWRLSHPAGGR